MNRKTMLKTQHEGEISGFLTVLLKFQLTGYGMRQAYVNLQSLIALRYSELPVCCQQQQVGWWW
jgi:hypothetical protein